MADDVESDSKLLKSHETVSAEWFEDEFEDDADASFKDYEVTAIPNDFNIKTIVDFVKSSAVKIPGFQRNYVWDAKRASRLIESILIGLPIPQIFLYEEGKNSFLVIDGQQRLMSIYYFVMGRFPRPKMRPILRMIMDKNGVLPDAIIGDDRYFTKFNLSLPGKGASKPSRFHKMNYQTLGDMKLQFDLRTIRNVVIKQTSPKETPDSSVFEIFNRLNTGGVNLRQQEIRTSLYHSEFLNMLRRVNVNETWRKITGLPEPDLHDKDVEVLLRACALVVDGAAYAEPMSAFLNSFSRKAMTLSDMKVKFVEELFEKFFQMIEKIPPSSFTVASTSRFNIAIFESVFRACCTESFKEKNLDLPKMSEKKIDLLKKDKEFLSATQQGVGRKAYVDKRYARAQAILLGKSK
ncbi:MAG: DUF262 domain-containing protein [Alphaproteobacteria bacterium]|jgi:hypothetical protein|nr:DUF262 domain-containing protein [Alphaproteobacteria bacterium]